jgi:Fur family ferric uptake transcriptional regulator
MREETRDAADRLRGARLRVTPIRLTVLQVVAELPHADVEELRGAVERRLGGVSKQAVYDSLRTLSEADLIRRIEPAGGPARYDARVGDNHHHVVCRVCGAVGDVDCAVGAAPCLEPSQSHGYRLDDVEITFSGVCPPCQSRASEPAKGTS